MSQHRFLVLLLVCLSVSVSGQASRRSSNTDSYSAEKESALGFQMASRVRAQTTPLGLPSVDSYVADVGRKLAAYAPNSPEPWAFRVMQDQRGGPTCESLSLPGGYIFVAARLVLAARNEAEFAGMLAHAMAHVAERQGIHRAKSGEQGQLASIPLIFMGGAIGDDEHLLVPVGLLNAQRTGELGADRVAVSMMAAAGYDPHALYNYIERTQLQDANYQEEFSSLPSRTVRLSNLNQMIQNLPAAQSRVDDRDFQVIQQEVRHKQKRASAGREISPIPSLIIGRRR